MKYYLLAITDHDNKTGFVMNFDDNNTIHDCKRIINWQSQGGFNKSDYAITKRIGKYDFEGIEDGIIYTFKERLIYTEKAYNEFINNWEC